jgi:DNA-binding response OmpR family regulator
VEDEPEVLDLVRAMLTHAGHSVIGAASGREALTLFGQDGIDLVITDLVMPGMDGKALAQELLRRDPTIRILISTGFSAESDIASLLEGGVRGVVMKPYQGEQLFSKIREALHGD